MNAWKHFKTITRHKFLVMKGCFQVGLYKQGILHDLSKYSPEEFFVGCKYYQGMRSPNAAEREVLGYSTAWMHHKGRNKHHYEYWTDIDMKNGGRMTGVPMPPEYIAEMLMDRIAASKVYQGDRYTDASPLAYYNRSKERNFMHPKTRKTLEKLLKMLARDGEKKTFAYIRRKLLRTRRPEF
ncbi:MAG: catalase [Lachnospiraceae bacterium]|nr:catalase [Lachnospiraceae bacterium]